MKVYAIIDEDYLSDGEGKTVTYQHVVKLFSTYQKASAFKHANSAEGDTYKNYQQRRAEWCQKNPRPTEENNPCPRSSLYDDLEYRRWRSNLDYQINLWKAQMQTAIGVEPMTFYYDIKEMEVE